MERKNEDALEIDLLRLARALWSKVWAIILVTILGGTMMAVYTIYLVTPMYTSSALMYVNSSNVSLDGGGNITLGDLTAAQSLISTYSVILESRNTLNDVIEEADLPYSYGQLAQMVSASSVNDTEVLRISVRSSNPEMAAKIANTIVRILPEKIASIVEGSSARIVDMAVIPTSPTSPNVVRNTIMGAMIGMLAVCALIVLQELMDDMVYDTDYLRQSFDLPVLAAIPDLMESGHGAYKYKYQYTSSPKSGKQ